MLLDTLLFGLLVGSSLGFGLGLDFSSLLCLLALYFRVFGGIPRVENLADVSGEEQLGSVLAKSNLHRCPRLPRRRTWWHGEGHQREGRREEWRWSRTPRHLQQKKRSARSRQD